MLVHICCSVDSHFFLQKLKEDFPNERLVGFFYNPNIHPYSEYKLRLLDVQRSCDRLGIELIEGEYDFKVWMKVVEGYEKEPEKGIRCKICFDKRFEVSAKKAREIGEKSITTTLLVSPKKSQDQLKKSGERLAKDYGLEFVYVDYRSNGGTQLQQQISKSEKLYRQNYCGCIFGLTIQRNQQNKLADELFLPIDKRVLPGSIKERLDMYKNRLKLEEKNQNYEIVRQKFLNYRLKFGWVRDKKATLSSYILPYSVMKRRYATGKVKLQVDGVYWFNKEEIRFITLENYNQLSQCNYKSVKELIFNPPPFETDMLIRQKIGLELWDLSPIVVLKEIPKGKIEILIESVVFEDVREKLVLL